MPACRGTHVRDARSDWQRAASAAVSGAATAGSPPRDLVREGIDLIDGTGGPVVRDAMIRIRGERIAYAGPRREEPGLPPAHRWQLPGKTVVPGLIEAHTHSTADADMLAYVKNGITSIRFAGLDLPTVRRLKARIDSGEL